MQIQVGLITFLLLLVHCKAITPPIYSTEFGPVMDPDNSEILLRIPFFSFNSNTNSARYVVIDFQVEGAPYYPPRYGIEVEWEPMHFTNVKIFGATGDTEANRWTQLSDNLEDLSDGRYRLGPHIPMDQSIGRRYLVVKVARANYIYKVTITSNLLRGQKIEFIREVKEDAEKPVAGLRPKRKMRYLSAIRWTPNLDGSSGQEDSDERQYNRRRGQDEGSSSHAGDHVD